MRFGLFGTGPWAHMAHAPALTAHKDVEFVGVWGRNPAKAAELATEHGVEAYGEIDALIADVDAIAVALPPDVQAPIALRAALAGKHLLLDKPVAFTSREADEIVAAVEERDLASVVFFTRRLLPEIADFYRDVVATGGWTEGRIEHVGTINQEGNPFGASPWRHEAGGLWDVGPHALAGALAVFGPVTEVTGMTGPRDNTHVLAKHASGAISSLTMSVDAPPAAGREDYAFLGEAGLRAVPHVSFEAVTALQLAIDHLLEAAAGGPKSPLDVRFGAQVTRILEAAAESIDSGRKISLI
ncbi:Gfo/Idh/MocA family oxidoreductase [Actinoplanes sp. TBRC 11911]|uniref:Gfo/Idh/MocA family protein n=1 Tax=Actinoplanes sp. TBRC 11911 TaxID=2729386 RepID=UPI00145EF08D|nr:Gfo/Idh/MocA family oxidoreductase [Actinoplanes sp. TBRC 11911]NMO50646.1 Gfo/Idh/MocA family oxidoreductase [Actinoplanes sp. TBRC 11911]